MVRRVRESVKTWGFHTRSCVKDAGKSDLKKTVFCPRAAVFCPKPAQQDRPKTTLK